MTKDPVTKDPVIKDTMARDVERVDFTLDDCGVAHVRLTRAEKMNAIDLPMFDALAAVHRELAALPGLRAVVLSGEGRAFCAGLDLARMGSLDRAERLAERNFGLANLAQTVALGWRELPVPVIAAVHGVAFGGGLQIMLGADIRLAAPGTRFAIMEAKWGLIPDMAGIALTRTLVRDDILRELTYTAREFSAEEACAFGMVTRVAADPLSEAMQVAKTIAGRSPHAVRAAKRLINAAVDQDLGAILEAETREQVALIGSPNQLESVMAGMAKRPPVFQEPSDGNSR